MKIQAATRLMAAADEAQARRFIKHYTGLKVGPKVSDNNDYISFSFDRSKADEVRKRLAKHFKKTAPGMGRSSFDITAFYADDSLDRIITVTTWLGTGGLKDLRATIALTDKAHYETYMQRLERLRKEKEAK